MQSYEEAVIAGVCTVESAMISMGVVLHKIQYFLFSLTSNLILKTEILNGYVFAVSVPSEKKIILVSNTKEIITCSEGPPRNTALSEVRELAGPC